jgi:hypothetical protein
MRRTNRAHRRGQDPLHYLGARYRQVTARQMAIDSLSRTLRRALRAYPPGAERRLLRVAAVELGLARHGGDRA